MIIHSLLIIVLSEASPGSPELRCNDGQPANRLWPCHCTYLAPNPIQTRRKPRGKEEEEEEKKEEAWRNPQNWTTHLAQGCKRARVEYSKKANANFVRRFCNHPWSNKIYSKSFLVKKISLEGLECFLTREIIRFFLTKKLIIVANTQRSLKIIHETL